MQSFVEMKHLELKHANGIALKQLSGNEFHCEASH